MTARPRLAILLAGLAAAAFLTWPGISINREGKWRTFLAGFQLQRETGDFIGGPRTLIHFHVLDGRPGRVRFTIAPRIEGDEIEVEISGSAGVLQIVRAREWVEVEVPINESRDLELILKATAASNPRPLRLSRLRIDRQNTTGSLARSLLPMLLGGLCFGLLSFRESKRQAGSFALFVVAASAWFVAAASDPVRILSLPTTVGEALPLVIAFGFATAGLRGAGSRSALMALVGVSVSLHLETVHSGFVYDDRLWARPWTLPELASTFLGSEDPRGISGDQYRPIPSLTHAVDHAVWGSSSFAFHGTNLALHATSAFLLFLLLQRLRLPRGPALLGALTLAVHPLAASSIGWISERTDTLTDIFMLATLLFFLGPNGARTMRLLGVGLLALWSKETAVMLPVLATLFAFLTLDAEQRRTRFAALRALFGLVFLYVAVWVSLFPEKTVGRLQATAATLQSEQSGWTALYGSLFGQLFHPTGYETWRATREGAPALWVVLAFGLGIASLLASVLDSARATPWRLVASGLAFSALVVLPFRGHDAVDVYRLGHTPTVGFGLVVAGLATILTCLAPWRELALAASLLVYFGPVARETSAAWGYPGFQFRMALRFNLENPAFLAGLTPEMKQDLERESLLVAHRDEPLKIPFEP